jgi:hypothetical protein
MTPDAFDRCASKDADRFSGRLELILVAAFACNIAVRHVQRKPRSIVTEIGCAPALHRVASRAIFRRLGAELAGMRVGVAT